MISFVVPAYNEERLVGRTLEALHDAARAVAEPYELIVVDDGSVDETAAIADANGARVVRVQFRHIARTRNAGAHAAVGDPLIFVDADTIVPAATVRATIEALRQGAVGGALPFMSTAACPFGRGWLGGGPTAGRRRGTQLWPGNGTNSARPV
jgi:glycosyltransferase involved in cell wall biosynthesis